MKGSVSKIFMGIAYILERFMPKLTLQLKQADIPDDAMTYISKTLSYSIFMFIMFSSLITYLFVINNDERLYFGPLLGFVLSTFMFYYRLNMPKMVVKKRVDNIEKNLAFAAQSLYVQISSGVPIFNAIVSLSNGRFGSISDEFRIAIKEIKSGKPLVLALDEVAMRNPSPYFQRVMWQIVNTLKTGGDLAENLNDIVKTISREQINVVKNYGGKLSPISMAYMMVSVIVPSLGITVLITLSSLPGMSAQVSTNTFWGILILAIILQFQFAMIIKSMRPNLVGE